MRRLWHLPSHGWEEISPAPEVSLGVVHRKAPCPEWDWYFDRQARLGVLIAGTMYCDRPRRHVVTASELAVEYRDRGFDQWQDFEGPFIAAVVDLGRRRLSLANDRLGLVPLYYGHRPGQFLFAPEAKGVLLEPGRTPSLNPAGVSSYLTAGYCVGDLTLFEDVHALEPCTLVSIDLSTLHVDRRRLWRLVYEPAPELRRRASAEEALAAAIIDAHGDIRLESPPGIVVMLSGGWDSRVMLAALDRVGDGTVRAESRGARDDVPGSDVVLARELAREFGVPFHFRRTTTETFLEHGRAWCQMSELVNCGWYSEIAESLTCREAASETVLVGDECLGWQGHVGTEEEAIGAVLPPVVPPTVKAVLEPGFGDVADELYRAAIQGVIRSCASANHVDRKDFLYLHGRVARFILPLRRYKDLTASVRRPLLANGVLDVVRRLPARHRLFKNLYISTLRHHFPRAMVVPVATATSLPDWSRDVRTNAALRAFFVSLLEPERLAQGPLGDMLDCAGVRHLREAFFADAAAARPAAAPWLAAQRRAVGHLLSRWQLASRAIDAIRPRPGAHAVPTFTLLHRVMLLSLLQESVL
jgi:hypothetical protein